MRVGRGRSVSGILRSPLRAWTTPGVAAVAARVKTSPTRVQSRLVKIAKVADFDAADEEDLRECCGYWGAGSATPPPT